MTEQRLVNPSSTSSAAPPAKLLPDRRTRTMPSPSQAHTDPLWPRPRPTGFPLRASAKRKSRPPHWDRPYVPRSFLHRGKGTGFPALSIRRRHCGQRPNRQSTAPRGLPDAMILRYREKRRLRGRSPTPPYFHPSGGDAANHAVQKAESAKSRSSRCRRKLRVAGTSAPRHKNYRSLLRTARIEVVLTAGVAAAGCCAGARRTVLQLRPRSRETSNPSSVAAYQASVPNAMSFTLACKGTVVFVVAGAEEFAAAFAAEVFVALRRCTLY